MSVYSDRDPRGFGQVAAGKTRLRLVAAGVVARREFPPDTQKDYAAYVETGAAPLVDLAANADDVDALRRDWEADAQPVWEAVRRSALSIAPPDT